MASFLSRRGANQKCPWKGRQNSKLLSTLALESLFKGSNGILLIENAWEITFEVLLRVLSKVGRFEIGSIVTSPRGTSANGHCWGCFVAHSTSWCTWGRTSRESSRGEITSEIGGRYETNIKKKVEERQHYNALEATKRLTSFTNRHAVVGVENVISTGSREKTLVWKWKMNQVRKRRSSPCF